MWSANFLQTIEPLEMNCETHKKIDLPQRNNPQLVNLLLEDVDHLRGWAEADNAVGLMVRNVGVPLEFRIDGFLDTAAVLTTSEHFKLAFFFFEFKVDDFMVNYARIGIFLKAGGSTVDELCAKCDSTHDVRIHAIGRLQS